MLDCCCRKLVLFSPELVSSSLGTLEAPLQGLFTCSCLHVDSVPSLAAHLASASSHHLLTPSRNLFRQVRVPSSVLPGQHSSVSFTQFGGVSYHWLVLRETCKDFSAPVAVSQPLAFSVSQLVETHARLSRGSFGEPLTRIRIRIRHSSTHPLFGRGLSSGSHRPKWTP